MGDKNRLTAAVQMEIDRFVEREMSVTISELYHQRSAEELLAFLTDETKLATPRKWFPWGPGPWLRAVRGAPRAWQIVMRSS